MTSTQANEILDRRNHYWEKADEYSEQHEVMSDEQNAEYFRLYNKGAQANEELMALTWWHV